MDWDIGNYLYVEKDVVCLKNDIQKMKPEIAHSILELLHREKLQRGEYVVPIAGEFDSPFPDKDNPVRYKKTYDSFVEAQRLTNEVMEKSRPDLEENCFGTLKFDLATLMKQSLRLKPEDSAYFKEHKHWPNLGSWSNFMKNFVGNSIVGVLESWLLLALPLIYDTSPWTKKFYYIIIPLHIYLCLDEWLLIRQALNFTKNLIGFCHLNGRETGVSVNEFLLQRDLFEESEEEAHLYGKLTNFAMLKPLWIIFFFYVAKCSD